MRLLRKIFSQETEPQESKRPPRKWWEFPFRFVRVSHYGPNMPKRQTCKKCGSQARRFSKELPQNGVAIIGANYRCRCGNRFFVAHRTSLVR